MTSEKINLLSDGMEVYEMRNLINNDSINEDLFIIDFKRHFMWELKKNDSILIVVEYGQLRLPKKRMNKELFTDHLKRIFSNIDENDMIDTLMNALQ